MILDGRLDAIEGAAVTGNNGVDPDGDGIANELPIALVDLEEFYLLELLQAGDQRAARLGQRGELGPHDLHQRRLRRAATSPA
jgi:hypothetical protein